MSNNQLYELLYTSRATNGFKEEELQDILEQSRKNNLRDEISGMLIYYKKSFVQILEGDQAKVLQLYQKISQDPRHQVLEVFNQGKISVRSFENWSMAGKALNNRDLQALLPDFAPLNQEHLSSHILNSSPSMGKNLFLKLKEELTS